MQIPYSIVALFGVLALVAQFVPQVGVVVTIAVLGFFTTSLIVGLWSEHHGFN